MVHGYREEGIKALNKIARFNGKDAYIPDDAIFEEVSNHEQQDQQGREDDRSLMTFSNASVPNIRSVNLISSTESQ